MIGRGDKRGPRISVLIARQDDDDDYDIYDIYIYTGSCLVGGCSATAHEPRVQALVRSYQRLKKWTLDTSLLNSQRYKVRIRVKWSIPGKE